MGTPNLVMPNGWTLNFRGAETLQVVISDDQALEYFGVKYSGYAEFLMHLDQIDGTGIMLPAIGEKNKESIRNTTLNTWEAIEDSAPVPKVIDSCKRGPFMRGGYGFAMTRVGTNIDPTSASRVRLVWTLTFAVQNFIHKDEYGMVSAMLGYMRGRDAHSRVVHQARHVRELEDRMAESTVILEKHREALAIIEAFDDKAVAGKKMFGDWDRKW